MNVSSRVENLSLINQKLEQLREEFKISKITYEKMLSSVNEAFMNAVDHGNKGDISKIVTFDHRILAEGKIVLTISDEGNGFNWKHAGGLPKDPEQEGGRGLFIIEHFSEKYCFNKKGNRIELHFTL